jgi:hypothetical protein
MAAALRTIEQIRAQARIDGLNDPPLTQEQADRVAAILAPHLRQLAVREPQAA